jgi:hypothetical protein
MHSKALAIWQNASSTDDLFLILTAVDGIASKQRCVG